MCRCSSFTDEHQRDFGLQSVDYQQVAAPHVLVSRHDNNNNNIDDVYLNHVTTVMDISS